MLSFVLISFVLIYIVFNGGPYFIFFAFLFNYVVVNFYLYHVVIVLCFNHSPIFIYFVVYLFYCYFIFGLLVVGPEAQAFGAQIQAQF